MSVRDDLVRLPLAEHVKSEARLGLQLGRKLLRVPYDHVQQARQQARLNLDELRRYKLVSFDLFDTLLRRRIDPPDYLKGAVARYISRLVAVRADVVLPPAEVQAQRDHIEKTLRQRARDQGLDPECRHEELINLLLAEVLRRPPTAAEVEQVLDFELRMETRALAPNPQLCQLMAQAKAAGLRVIVASDMYLSGKQLQALLDAHGVTRPDALYASADLLLCKGSGRLFQHIMDRENVGPKDLIHIGDNPGSDVYAPRQLGITALCYYDTREQLRRPLTAHTLQRVQRGHRRGAALPVELAQAFTPPAPPHATATYELGYRVLGPVYCVFLHRVMLRAEELRLAQLHFVAREGFLLKQIYETLLAELHPLHRPTLYYTHLSRLSTSLPQLLHLAIHQLPLHRPLEHGAVTVLRSYGLYDDEVLGTLRAAGVAVPDAPLPPWSDPALQRFLHAPALAQLVSARARPAHELFRRYLVQQGFFGCGRAALVDIGWSGTIQNNMARAFGSDPAFPELYGFYMALADLPLELRQHVPRSSHKEGLVYDYRADSQSLRDRAPYWFEELFELPAQPPHGTTLGYALHGERVEPVLKPMLQPVLQPDNVTANAAAVAERHKQTALAEIQRGILDYARLYGQFAELGNVSLARQVEEAKREVAQFVFHPSARGLEAVRALMHTPDWGVDDNQSLLAQEGLLSWLREGRAGYQRFGTAMWKHGEARRLGGPLLSQLYRLYTWCRY